MEKEQEELKETDSVFPTTSIRPFIFLLGGVIAIWVISGIALYPDVANRGTFGDMFGAVNSLFSGLAFASLVYTILLQRKELQLQRQELVYTRAELAGQKQQMSLQNDVLKIQNFENTFFQLVRLLNDIVNSIDLVDGQGKVTHGRDCLSTFYRRFVSDYHQLRKNYPSSNELRVIQQSYTHFNQRYQNELGHYFRTLYNIIKFVRNSDVGDKNLYTNLVRAQLSSQELLLLFYVGLSEEGYQKFKPLIEEFALLKNVPMEAVIHPQFHPHLYRPCAYGAAYKAPDTNTPLVSTVEVEDLSLGGQISGPSH